MTDVWVSPDAERATVDIVSTLTGWAVADFDPPATTGATTVGIGVPSWWMKDRHGPHLQIAWDGGDQLRSWGRGVIGARELIRLTAWSSSTSEAKALLATALAHLDAYLGGPIVSGFVPAARTVPTRDPDTSAEMATAAVSATVRTTPLT